MLTNQLMRLWASHRVWEHKLQRLAPSAPGSRSRCPGFFLGIRYVPRCTKTPPHPTPPPGPRPPNVDSQNSSIWRPMIERFLVLHFPPQLTHLIRLAEPAWTPAYTTASHSPLEILSMFAFREPRSEPWWGHI